MRAGLRKDRVWHFTVILVGVSVPFAILTPPDPPSWLLYFLPGFLVSSFVYVLLLVYTDWLDDLVEHWP